MPDIILTADKTVLINHRLTCLGDFVACIPRSSLPKIFTSYLERKIFLPAPTNTGITAALASLEAVKELGLDKAAIGCLAGLPVNVADVYRKTKAARKIITVDGCSVECSRKVVENAGFKPAKSFMLVRDIGMKKKPLHEDIGGDLKAVMEYISEEDVKKAKELIIEAINDKVS